MCRGDSGIARRPTRWGGWDVEDAVPYDFVKSSTERVGAGLPDGPPMPKASEKPPLRGGGTPGTAFPTVRVDRGGGQSPPFVTMSRITH